MMRLKEGKRGDDGSVGAITLHMIEKVFINLDESFSFFVST